MKAVKMNELLLELVKYNFYSWQENEDDKDNLNAIKLGIPKNLLKNTDFENLYDSWGYEAVNNPYAQPNFTIEQWGQLEKLFFEWLKKLENIIFPNGRAIVTPFLERAWELSDNDFQEECSDNQWIKSDYDKYIELLQDSEIISKGPSLREDYRGGLLDNYSEFEIIGRVAIKNLPLLFFSNEDRVVTITEYLSVIIEFRDKEACMDFQEKLNKSFGFQILK